MIDKRSIEDEIKSRINSKVMKNIPFSICNYEHIDKAIKIILDLNKWYVKGREKFVEGRILFISLWAFPLKRNIFSFFSLVCWVFFRFHKAFCIFKEYQKRKFSRGKHAKPLELSGTMLFCNTENSQIQDSLTI